MLLKIPAVLKSEELAAMVKVLSESEFVDGKLSAGMAAERVKNNQELSREQPQRETLAKLIMGAMFRSDTFRNAVLPNKHSTPIFARYTAGMAYGDHVDDPLMGSGPYFRTDVSFTVFLSEPESYEGGELTVRTSWGEQQVKLQAGDAVVYPSGTLHRVEPVRSGERLVALGWVQSMVRDPAQRELLFELCRAREILLERSPAQEETEAVDHAYINLLRMWSEV